MVPYVALAEEPAARLLTYDAKLAGAHGTSRDHRISRAVIRRRTLFCNCRRYFDSAISESTAEEKSFGNETPADA